MTTETAEYNDSTPSPTISIVVPAYNEQDHIADTIRQILSGIPNSVADYELIIVDDGSTDSTGDIIRAFTNPRIRYVVHKHNIGKGAALISGFRQACMEWVLFTDADLQINISNLESFFKQADGSDIITGYRQKRQDPLMRLVSSKIYTAVIHVVLGFHLRDIGCPFKLIRKSFLDECQLHSRGFFIDTELIHTAFTKGLRIKELGVACQPRQKGKSTVRLRHVFEMVRELLELLHRC